MFNEYMYHLCVKDLQSSPQPYKTTIIVPYRRVGTSVSERLSNMPKVSWLVHS